MFVGRHQELKRLDELLWDPRGQAILVLGQQGMGKTMLVNRFARLAADRSDLKCGSVRYEVTPTDGINDTLTLMMGHAFEAGRVQEGSFDATPRRRAQWKALLDIVKLGDLVLSLRIDPQRNIRDQFIQRLELLSEKMPEDGRALFIIDPEKYMQAESDQAWAVIARELPERIKLVFAQRPDDVLARSDMFRGCENVVSFSESTLGCFDEATVDELLDLRSSEWQEPIGRVREAVLRYQGHPYATVAALDLVADGIPTADLPADPSGIAAAQWNRAAEHSPKAIRMIEAYAVLDVPVPDEVVSPVAELDRPTLEHLLAQPFLGGLVSAEGDGRRIYQSLLAEHVTSRLADVDAGAYHRRAVETYRQRLHAQEQPDVLAAERLPEHVLVVDGPGAFVHVFVKECSGPLLTLGRLDRAIELSHRALDTAPPDSAVEADVHGCRGVIYQTRGDLNKAERMHRWSLDIYKQLGRLNGMACGYGNLGVIYHIRGDLDKAERMLRRALRINKRLGRLKGMANQWGNLGLIYESRGDLDNAERMHRRALGINKRLGRLEGMAIQYGNLGSMYQTRGDLDNAERMHRRALGINKRLGRLEGMANQCGNLGVVCRERGDLDEARKLWLQARDLYGRIGMPHMVEKVQGWLDTLDEPGEE